MNNAESLYCKEARRCGTKAYRYDVPSAGVSAIVIPANRADEPLKRGNMFENFDAIYQCGERVPFNGTFEMVGFGTAHDAKNNQEVLCELVTGEPFPAYNGMEVCWYATLQKCQVNEALPPANS